VHAARFDGIERKVTDVGGYSKSVNYDANHCIIYFDSDLPSGCNSKARAVVYLDKEVGSLMCSIALTALVTDKVVKVSSMDDCDPTHGAPVLRWVSVAK